MKLISALEKEFKHAQDPFIAPQMSAYMRNMFAFYGIKKPQRNIIEKRCFAQYPVNSQEELIALLHGLWDKPQREFQMTAMVLAYKYRKLWAHDFLITIEQLIRTKSWWDTVDALASKMLGTLLLMYPELQKGMDHWIKDKNFWIRRSAIIYQLSYKDKTNKEQLFRYCRMRMHEEEFFIRKAIGWALRQYARTNAKDVRGFLHEHQSELSALSYREAGKHCLKQLS